MEECGPSSGMDLGNTPVTDYRKHTPSTEHTTPSHLPPIPHPDQEGLQDDKQTDGETHHTIPGFILPAQHRPKHHRPDLIRVVGYTLGPNGQLIKDHTFRGRRQIQLIEYKYSRDGNITDIIKHIHTIYEPLKQALLTHGKLKADIKIIPIIITKTGTFKNLAEIAQLVSFHEEPPNAMTFKQLPYPTQK
jgi:hypothetical protein